MLSRKMRIRRLVLSVVLLVVILTVLKLIQPEKPAVETELVTGVATEQCDSCQSDGERCTNTDCHCCHCGE